MTSRLVSTPGLMAALLVPLAAAAQQLETPVRYDSDLLGPDFHEGRRAGLMAGLPPNALAIVFGAPTRNRSNDVSYEYRQSSDFLYLTGSDEPGSALLVAPGGIEVDGRTVREVLFVPPRDPSQEVWLGRRFGPEGAMAQLGVELAVDADRFDEILEPLLRGGTVQVFHHTLPTAVEPGSPLDRQVATFREHAAPIRVPRAARSAGLLSAALVVGSSERFARLKEATFDPRAFDDPVVRGWAEAFAEAGTLEGWSAERSRLLVGFSEGSLLPRLLTDLRTIKTPEEMTVLQRAIDITAEAHREVMRQVEPGWAEYEIEALIEYTFKRNGSEHPGFPSIVGSGENSVILHYETNRRVTEPGDLVVIDIGAEYHGYTADVTRTIPVDGRFTGAQRQIYELVYEAQQAGIEASRAGTAFYGPHRAAEDVLSRGLADLGLIDGPEDRRGLRRFFMHGTSHYLGLDVHDVGSGGPLAPGTVITVEPGIYIAPADDIDPSWWNIGVRIEDDVLITDGDPVVLSAEVPGRVDEIEALMGGRGF